MADNQHATTVILPLPKKLTPSYQATGVYRYIYDPLLAQGGSIASINGSSINVSQFIQAIIKDNKSYYYSDSIFDDTFNEKARFSKTSTSVLKQRVELGNNDAAYELAVKLLLNGGNEGAILQGLYYLEKAAHNGHAKSKLSLAILLMTQTIPQGYLQYGVDRLSLCRYFGDTKRFYASYEKAWFLGRCNPSKSVYEIESDLRSSSFDKTSRTEINYFHAKTLLKETGLKDGRPEFYLSLIYLWKLDFRVSGFSLRV